MTTTTTSAICSRSLRELEEKFITGVQLCDAHRRPAPARTASRPLLEMGEEELRVGVKHSLFQMEDGDYRWTDTLCVRKMNGQSDGDEPVLQLRLIKIGETTGGWTSVSDCGDIVRAAYGTLKKAADGDASVAVESAASGPGQANFGGGPRGTPQPSCGVPVGRGGRGGRCRIRECRG